MCGAGQVDVQLYDMISGTQLYHSRHKQYSGPVHMLVVENWLVYHMWCSKLRRYEVVVVEFFLPSAPNTLVLLLSQYLHLFLDRAPMRLEFEVDRF